MNVDLQGRHQGTEGDVSSGHGKQRETQRAATSDRPRSTSWATAETIDVLAIAGFGRTGGPRADQVAGRYGHRFTPRRSSCTSASAAQRSRRPASALPSAALWCAGGRSSWSPRPSGRSSSVSRSDPSRRGRPFSRCGGLRWVLLRSSRTRPSSPSLLEACGFCRRRWHSRSVWVGWSRSSSAVEP